MCAKAHYQNRLVNLFLLRSELSNLALPQFTKIGTAVSPCRQLAFCGHNNEHIVLLIRSTDGGDR